MAIKFELDNLKAEHVPLPAAPERKAKEAKGPRISLTTKLVELGVEQSYFLEGKKKVNIASQISAAKKAGNLTGTFKVVEYGVGGDSKHVDKAGCRVWRVTVGEVTSFKDAAE